MAKYEDLIQRLREEGMEDLADDFEEFSATTLRKKAAAYDEVVTERDLLKSQVTTLIDLPKKEQALKDAGVDFDALRPAEKKLIRELKMEGELTDWVAKVISENELPVSESFVQETDEEPAAERVAKAARSAPTGGSPSSTTLSAESVKDWPTDKLLQFRDEHPDEWEALKRGETVKGVVA